MSTDPIAILDGELMPAAEARLPVTDPGLLRGDAVFEVVRIYAGVPFALAEHLARMARSAAAIRLPFDPESVEADIRDLLAASNQTDVVVRVVVTRGGHRIGLIEQLRPVDEPLTLQTITYSPTRVLEQVKSVSYAGNMLATRIAQEQGADEALLVTPHDRVLEGPTFSVFLRTGDGAWVTPPLDDQVLDSITRRLLLNADLGASEQIVRRDDLAAASEVVAVSTTREVQPVSLIDGHAVPVVGGPATVAAQQALRRSIEAEVARG